MHAENLADMANRIGTFFASMPDHEEALVGIAEHVARYWEPRMRRKIFALVDGADADRLLKPIVLEALRAHREALAPAELDSLPIPPQGESEA